jgi:sugar lactone lactonase YvrE
MRRTLAILAIMSSGALLAAAAPAPIDLPGDRLFPESVSIGPGRIAYISSMNGGVLRVPLATGKPEAWIKPGAFGNGAQFGVLADPRNRLVWTCTNDFSARGVVVPGSDKGHVIKGFDLRTGEGRISLELPGEKAVCNDFAVAKDGTFYATDTGQPRILRWKPGAKALEVWLEDAAFDGPSQPGGLDGLAFGSDGNLYVNNVRTGDLFRVGVGRDGKPAGITRLTLSRPLSSPDGMRAIGGLSFAVAEGTGRIARIDVHGDRAEITTLAEGITAPTGVDVDGNTIWYVQAHLAALFSPANTPAPVLPFKLTPVAAGKAH